MRAALLHFRGRVRARAGMLKLPCVPAPAYNTDTDMATKTHTATQNEPPRHLGLNIPETRGPSNILSLVAHMQTKGHPSNILVAHMQTKGHAAHAPDRAKYTSCTYADKRTRRART